VKEKSPVLGTRQHELVVVTADNTCHWAGVGFKHLGRAFVLDIPQHEETV
jgi:hypothetical protein